MIKNIPIFTKQTENSEQMLNDDIRAYLLPRAFNAAVKAGSEIMKVYKNSDDYDITVKSDKTPLTIADPDADPHAFSMDNDRYDALLKAFSTLDEKDRDILLSRHCDNPLTLSELGKKYGVSPCAVATAFLSSLGENVEIVIGALRKDYIQESLDGIALPLEREDWYRLYCSAGNVLP